jgi:hypothetical protein
VNLRRKPRQRASRQEAPSIVNLNLGNLLELVGAGLLIYGVYVLAGWGGCVITGAACAVVMAEYLYGDTVLKIPLGRRKNRLPRLPQQPTD